MPSIPSVFECVVDVSSLSFTVKKGGDLLIVENMNMTPVAAAILSWIANLDAGTEIHIEIKEN